MTVIVVEPAMSCLATASGSKLAMRFGFKGYSGFWKFGIGFRFPMERGGWYLSSKELECEATSLGETTEGTVLVDFEATRGVIWREEAEDEEERSWFRVGEGSGS